MNFNEIKKSLLDYRWVGHKWVALNWGSHTRGFYLKLSAVVLFGLFVLVSTGMMNSKERRVERVRSELTRFEGLRAEYLAQKASLRPAQRRLAFPITENSVGAVLEGIGGQLGVRSNMTSFKPVAVSVKQKGYVLDAVELKLEGVTLNELVNFLYRVENHRNLLMVREFAMTSRVEDSGVLDVTMQVALAVKEK